MSELLTAAQMRAIEQAAIEAGEVTGLELMERAGAGVVEAIFEEWPELGDQRGPAPVPPGYLQTEEGARRAVVLCGPGNNGGDGFVVARLLQERGWAVEVFLYGQAEKLPVDARVNYERWAALGATAPLNGETLKYTALPSLIVDAVFGTGLARPIQGDLAQVLGALDAFRDHKEVRIVAVDMPSGLCSDSGRHLGVFAIADLTISFHSGKVGHYLSRAPEQVGKLMLVSIGLGAGDPGAGIEQPVVLVDAVSRRMTSKRISAHKYAHGHALMLAGGPGETGAARLAARGALRVGAGLVTLGVPPSAQMEVASQITAIMLKRLAHGAALAQALTDQRLNALCLGPGLGLDARAADMVLVALDAGRATVLDADALTLIARDTSLFSRLHKDCILTPHGGEFARLFPDVAEKLAAPATTGPAYSKVDATREAAARAGCVVLFKGADTVIASHDGRCALNSADYERAAPWLATAGSGDVLAGFITGLLARGFAPMMAAETGAWLHVEAARKFGPGLIAEDLPEQLPAVFRDLGL